MEDFQYLATQYVHEFMNYKWNDEKVRKMKRGIRPHTLLDVRELFVLDIYLLQIVNTMLIAEMDLNQILIVIREAASIRQFHLEAMDKEKAVEA